MKLILKFINFLFYDDFMIILTVSKIKDLYKDVLDLLLWQNRNSFFVLMMCLFYSKDLNIFDFIHY